MFLASCMKLEAPEPTTATQFRNLKVNETFSWQTSRPVTLKISGIATAIPIRSTLVVSNLKGDTLRMENRLMEESLVIPLQVTAVTDSLVLSFGSIRKTYKVQSEIEANYIIPITEQEN